MSSPRDVVITGLGVVSPLGVGIEAYWKALEAGQSGIDWLPETAGVELPFRYAARIKDFDAKQFVQPRKSIKVMCQEIQAAYAAAGLTWRPRYTPVLRALMATGPSSIRLLSRHIGISHSAIA